MFHDQRSSKSCLLKLTSPRKRFLISLYQLSKEEVVAMEPWFRCNIQDKAHIYEPKYKTRQPRARTAQLNFTLTKAQEISNQNWLHKTVHTTMAATDCYLRMTKPPSPATKTIGKIEMNMTVFPTAPRPFRSRDTQKPTDASTSPKITVVTRIL